MFLPLMNIFLPSPVKIGSAPEETISGHASDKDYRDYKNKKYMILSTANKRGMH